MYPVSEPTASHPAMTVIPAHELAAAKHVAARDAQIPDDLFPKIDVVPSNPSKLYRSVLSAREVQIVELDATGLAAAIAKRTYTAVEVTEAYLKSAVVAHIGTNCLAWFDAESARQRAQRLDEQMERGGPVGPMHGVPMSVKGRSKDWRSADGQTFSRSRGSRRARGISLLLDMSRRRTQI